MNSPFETGMNLACNKDGVLVGNTDNLKEFGIEIEKKQNEELKPCPFCGGKKLKIESTSKKTDFSRLNGLNESRFSVRCNNCHSRGGVSGGYTRNARYPLTNTGYELFKSSEELISIAVERWNNRTNE